MTIGVPIVTCLPRLYQQCTNGQKQSKTVKRHSKQKNDHWCTNRYMFTKTVPIVKNSQKQLKDSKNCKKSPLVY